MVYLLRRRGLGNTSCNAIVAKSRTGIEVRRNDGELPPADMVIRWGCTSTVQADVIVNCAKAIHAVTDKKGFRLALAELGGLPTWPAENVPDDLTYPVVLRPPTHHQGRELYACYDAEQLNAAIDSHPDGYVSPLIEKTAEYRVYVVCGRVIAIASKTPPEDGRIAWNHAQGGHFENVRWGSWPLDVIRKALVAFNLSGLDFSGIDVMVGADGAPWVLEANSAPSLTSEYRQTCMTKAFDHIVDNGKFHFDVQEAEGWRGYIHPAISDEARL